MVLGGIKRVGRWGGRRLGRKRGDADADADVRLTNAVDGGCVKDVSVCDGGRRNGRVRIVRVMRFENVIINGEANAAADHADREGHSRGLQMTISFDESEAF